MFHCSAGSPGNTRKRAFIPLISGAPLSPTSSVQIVGRVEERNPTNHDEYQTRIRPSAFGVDLDMQPFMKQEVGFVPLLAKCQKAFVALIWTYDLGVDTAL